MSITAANAIYSLSIPGLYNTPQQLQGFSADDIIGTDPIDSAEVLMGVDGVLSAGFVYVPMKQAVTLQADSPSNDIFENWWNAQQAISDLYNANGIIVFTGIGKKYTMTNGFLTSYPPLADAGKTLKPRKYGITWQLITPGAS